MNKRISLGIAALCGAFLLVGFASAASAAVTNATSTPLQLNALVTTSSTFPVFRIDMANTSTTLSSTTITVSTTSQVAAPTALASSSFNYAALYFDADANGLFDASDTLVGTTTVNVNTPTVITPATTTNAVGTFFVVLQTSGLWTDNGAPVGATSSEQFVAAIGTSSVVTSLGVSTTTPTSTPAFTADTHSETVATSSLTTFFGGGAYRMVSSGGADEAGVMSIYSSSTATSSTIIATSSVNQSGAFATTTVGGAYLPSVWVSLVDALGNPASALAQYNLPAAPTVTGIKAFTDRIIVNTSANLNGGQATQCSNYFVNGGSPQNCGSGPNTPYINFNGNQVSIMGLSLASPGTISFSVATNSIQDTTPDQFPLNFTTSSLTVQNVPVPSISSVSPTQGVVGGSLTIAGSSFGSATGTVLFSGGFSQSTGPLPPVQASTTAWSGSSITATVPAGAQTGPVVVVTSQGMTSNVTPSSIFYVLGNVYVKLYLTSTSSPITTSTNMEIFIGGPNGMATYYVGDGSTSFNTSTYVYTISNIPAMGFAWAYDASATDLPAPGQQFQNTSSTNPLQLILPGAAAGKIIGTVDLGSTYGANKSVAVMALPQGTSTAMGPGGVQPQFFTANGNGTTSYAIAVPVGTYNVEAHLPPSTSTTPLIDPAGQSATISGTTTTVTLNFTYAAATREIYGQVVGANGNPLPANQYNGMWVVAYQPTSGGNSSVANPNSSGYFTVYANNGVYNLNVSGNNVPAPIEKNVTVTASSTFNIGASSPVVTIVLQPPSSYISGTVKDNSGNAVSGVNMNAFCTVGPGQGHATTDSQGSYQMYLPPCSNYDVNGFAQNYGKLPDQTGVSVSNNGSATVNFTLSSSNFVNVSGIAQQNSSNLSGANIWITEGDPGMGMGGGQTDANGNFSIPLQKGLSNLYLHVALNGQGQIIDQQLNGGSAVNSNLSVGTINAQTATIEIHLYPGNTFSQVFLGAQSSVGGGYTNTATAIGATSTYDTYDITVPYSGSTTYTVSGGIPGFGPIPATTTAVSGNTTISINLGSSYYTVSGSVAGSYLGAYVWAGGSQGGGGTSVSTSTGSFSLQLKPGTYDIGVNKPGYVGSVISSLNVSAATSGLSLSLTTSSATISGTAEYNGTAVANARVWATSPSGGWSGTLSDANGNFTLNVGTGSYTLNAIADGYQGVPQVVSSGASGVVLNLTSVSFSPNQQIQSVTPSQGGILQTTSTQLSLPAGALGSGSSNVQLSITNTMNTPDTPGMKVVGTGQNISASYTSGSNSGQSITTLSSNATVEMVLTKSQLVSEGVTSLSQAEQIVIGYYDTTANAWVSLPTTITLSPLGATWNTLVSITYSGTTSHFSTYAPVLPTSGSAPATPSGLSASGGYGQVALSWGSVSGAANYDIYRYNGSAYAYLTQVSGTSYTDIGVSNGTSYSYKVTALDNSGNESAASSPVSATPVSVPGTASVSGGGGGGYVAPTVSAATSTATTITTQATATTTAQAVPAAQTTPVTPATALPAIGMFTSRLAFGMTNSSVKSLQEFLAEYKDVYPEGIVSGYFGSLTKKAVEKFQEKYGIARPGIVGYGEVGPHTRAKLNELITAGGQPPVTTPAAPTKTSLAPAQISAVLSFLRAFDVDPATIARVEAILGQ